MNIKQVSFTRRQCSGGGMILQIWQAFWCKTEICCSEESRLKKTSSTKLKFFLLLNQSTFPQVLESFAGFLQLRNVPLQSSPVLADRHL